MAPLPPSREERSALCDLMLALGPDAPTLCEGWSAADLAAHLVIRERQPLASPGIILGGPFRAALERAMATTRARPFEELVASIRSGPPLLWRPLDPLVNLHELFVHHEDLRRGSGSEAPRPAAQIRDTEEAIWRTLGRGSRLLARSLGGIGLDLVDPAGRVIHARRGAPLAVLSGRPGEVLLYLMGRKAASQTEVTGDERAAEVLRSARLGV
ncbi:MAG: TIGR03085 family metal-binding protein [Actinobacteria bacterium]|nr:TIGR03085 family metal-binding protein [Actinomycetota bacterium]